MLAYLVEEAARRLGEDWDIEIVETHHRMKVDAPRYGAPSGRSRRARAPDPP
jgi:4-hydroxy-tetrahydrodipicolinate reductase